MYRRQKDKTNCSHSARYRKKTVELLVIACVQPPLPSNKILFEEGEGCTKAILDRQVYFVPNSTSSIHWCLPSLHNSCYICAFLGDRRTKGVGRSAPRVASRLPLLTWHQTSDVSMSSDIRVRHGILDIEHRTSDIGSGISDIRQSILDIRHQISDIRNQTSDIGYRTTDIRRRSMDVGRQISRMGCILRLFTVLYFSVRSSRWSALRYGLPS